MERALIMRSSHRFRHFADPICIGSIVTYLIGRFILRPHQIGGTFTQGYLNDVLCLPLFLPMILGVQGLVRLRDHDGPPRIWEVLQHWVIFSVVFEIVLPLYPRYFRTTADPLDVVAYLAGGLAAWTFWAFRHREPTSMLLRMAPRLLAAIPQPSAIVEVK